MIVVPSTLDAVTVHAEGALCTRLALVPAARATGPQQVRIEGLPLSLRPGSLRVAVRQGPTGLSVRDVRPLFDVRLPPEADLPVTQRALEEAQEKLAALTAAQERLQRDLQSLRQLKPSFPPRPKSESAPPRDASPEAVLALADFVDAELAALLARQLDLERQQRDAVAEVELRRRRLEEGSSAARGQRTRVTRAALVTLSEASTAEAPVQLALEYAVPGARWVPGYDLRMTSTLDGGTLRMRASLLQDTGEDWTQVRVSLSTALLERRAEVPELKALRIGRHQPPPPRSGWREPPPGLDELFTDYDEAQSTEPEPLPPLAPPPPPPAERTRVREFAMPPPPPAPPSLQRISQTMPSVSAPAPGAAPRGAPRGGLLGAGGGAPPLPTAAVPLMKKPQAPAAPAPMRRRQEQEDDLVEEEGAEEFDEAPGESMRTFGSAEASMDMNDETAPLELEGSAPRRSRSRPPQGPESGGLEPMRDLLDYGALMLGGADEAGGRGRLRPRHEALTPEQQVLLVGMHLHLDVFALVASAERRCEAVQEVAPPTWGVPPEHSAPHFDHRFDVETRVDVPSDGAWHTVPVFSAPVGLSVEYVCVPSVEPRVFRTVKVDNHTPHALLAGPVDVTLGDEFLMTSPLPTLTPGATQRLGLGVEEALKVSRNTRFDELSGGMFNNQSTLVHQVRVELANRTPQRVTVEVLERVPVAPLAEKDIKVEETEVKPAWSKRVPPLGETPVEGERSWRLVLQPGETQALSATWSIRIPSNKLLVGGNRRT